MEHLKFSTGDGAWRTGAKVAAVRRQLIGVPARSRYLTHLKYNSNSCIRAFLALNMCGVK